MYVSGGLGPAKILQLWKELTNGLSEDKTTSRGSRNHCGDTVTAGNGSGRRSGDERRYNLSSAARTRTVQLPFYSLNNRDVSSVDSLSLSSSLREPVGFCSKILFCLSPPDNIYCILFFCFAPQHLRRCGREKFYTTTCPESKVPRLFFQALPSTSCHLKGRDAYVFIGGLFRFVVVVLPFPMVTAL